MLELRATVVRDVSPLYFPARAEELRGLLEHAVEQLEPEGRQPD
jgi:hypothetical protein